MTRWKQTSPKKKTIKGKTRWVRLGMKTLSVFWCLNLRSNLNQKMTGLRSTNDFIWTIKKNQWASVKTEKKILIIRNMNDFRNIQFEVKHFWHHYHSEKFELFFAIITKFQPLCPAVPIGGLSIPNKLHGISKTTL